MFSTSTIRNIDNNLQDLTEPILIKTLLLGSNSFDTNTNTDVLNLTLDYVLSTKKFIDLFSMYSLNIVETKSVRKLGQFSS